jgi:hypothetical protein
MGKGRFFGSIAGFAVVVLLASYWGGCGTSNDQGISFRALGFFSDTTGETGESGRSTPLACTDRVEAAIGLENVMIQGIQVERVQMTYRIAGSSLQMQPSQEAISGRLGPSSGQEPSNPPRGFFDVLVLSDAQIDFLDQNRSQLPEFPFRLIATAQGVGTTDSGDVFFTNKVSYTVDFLDDDACGGTDGTPTGEETPTPTA